jgi:hypothetical protein
VNLLLDPVTVNQATAVLFLEIVSRFFHFRCKGIRHARYITPIDTANRVTHATGLEFAERKPTLVSAPNLKMSRNTHP